MLKVMFFGLFATASVLGQWAAPALADPLKFDIGIACAGPQVQVGFIGAGIGHCVDNHAFRSGHLFAGSMSGGEATLNAGVAITRAFSGVSVSRSTGSLLSLHARVALDGGAICLEVLHLGSYLGAALAAECSNQGGILELTFETTDAQPLAVGLSLYPCDPRPPFWGTPHCDSAVKATVEEFRTTD